MKHTLPWNVTGIPPEAREIARSAANREGATVGEWLTRRILANQERDTPLPEAAEDLTPPFRYSHEEVVSSSRTGFAPGAPRPEMAPESLRRMDEAFRALVQRLENNERGQMEAQRAMSAAAHEINAATRDQARAFQHLNMRIERVERHTDTASLRDAVRGLHQGLSRLAEAIAKTTNDSSEKIAALSNIVELLAGKMISAQHDSQSLKQVVDEKLASLETRVFQNEDRLGGAEERLAAAMRLGETVSELDKRMESIELRVQESLGHYLTGIERGLEQIGERLQRAERHAASDGGTAEAVRSLAARLEALEKKDKQASGAAEAHAGDVAEPSEPPQSPSPLPLPGESASVESSSTVNSLPPIADESPFVNATDVPRVNPDLRAAPDLPAEHPMAVGQAAFPAENYLAHARRAARPVPESSERRLMSYRIRNSERGAFREHRAIPRAAAAGLLAVLLTGGGIILARGMPGHANVLASNTSHLLALDMPRSDAAAGGLSDSARAPALLPQVQAPAAPVDLPPAVSAANSVAVASVFPLGHASGNPLAQLITKANAGDAKAAMVLGLKYADGDGVAANDTEAVFWLQKAAESGEAVAQYRLGTLYERGRGVASDTTQAMRWYSDAAKQGNRRAMHNLAVIYADGNGPQKNFLEAARWFKNAADLGLTDSQFNLAVLYERGLGVKASLGEAYKWYAIAAESGDAESKTRLAALASQITFADREAAERAAKAYKPRPVDIAANNG